MASQSRKSPVRTFMSPVTVRSTRDIFAISSLPANMVTATGCTGSRAALSFPSTSSTDPTRWSTGAIPTAKAATGTFESPSRKRATKAATSFSIFPR
jgi:hypothetical protein